MPREGFETTIPVFERANTVHALDHAAAVIGFLIQVKKKDSITSIIVNGRWEKNVKNYDRNNWEMKPNYSCRWA
jgi:hypothetical protein